MSYKFHFQFNQVLQTLHQPYYQEDMQLIIYKKCVSILIKLVIVLIKMHFV